MKNNEDMIEHMSEDLVKVITNLFNLIPPEVNFEQVFLEIKEKGLGDTLKYYNIDIKNVLTKSHLQTKDTVFKINKKNANDIVMRMLMVSNWQKKNPKHRLSSLINLSNLNTKEYKANLKFNKYFYCFGEHNISKPDYQRPMDLNIQSAKHQLETCIEFINKMSFDGYILAGGSIISMFKMDSIREEPDDYDFFIVVGKCNSKEEEIEKAKFIYRKLLEEIETLITPSIKRKIVRNVNCTSIFIFENEYNFITIQIIHKIYQSEKDVLLGFDLAPSKFMYKKGEFYGTYDAIMSYRYNIMPMDITSISSSFGHRVKKYINRKSLLAVIPGMLPMKLDKIGFNFHNIHIYRCDTFHNHIIDVEDGIDNYHSYYSKYAPINSDMSVSDYNTISIIDDRDLFYVKSNSKCLTGIIDDPSIGSSLTYLIRILVFIESIIIKDFNDLFGEEFKLEAFQKVPKVDIRTYNVLTRKFGNINSDITIEDIHDMMMDFDDSIKEYIRVIIKRGISINAKLNDEFKILKDITFTTSDKTIESHKLFKLTPDDCYINVPNHARNPFYCTWMMDQKIQIILARRKCKESPFYGIPYEIIKLIFNHLDSFEVERCIDDILE